MLIYYNNAADICISFLPYPTANDTVIHLTADVATITAGDNSYSVDRVGQTLVKEVDGKLVIDFNSETEGTDGFELGVTDSESIVIMNDGEVIAEITPEDPEPGPGPDPEPPTPVDPDEEAIAQGKKCKVGTDYFDHVKEAFETAVAGTPLVITMIADEEDSAGFGFFNAQGDTNKNITIDLNGKNLNFVGPAVGSAKTESQALHLEKDNTLTIKNGTMSAHNSTGIKMFVQNYCDLTIDGVTIDCSDIAAISYVSSNNFGNCTIKDSTLVPASGKVGVDCWFGLSKVYDTGVSVTINNSAINGIIEYGAQKASLTREGNEDWYTRTVLTINNSTFDSIVNSGAGANDLHTIVIDGTKMEQALPIVPNVEG